MRPCLVVQPGDDARQHPDRVHRRAAIHARMQIQIRAGDGHFLAQQPAQRGGDAGGVGVEQAGVADQRQIGGQFGGVLLHERHQRGRAGFLLALQEERQPAGQGAVHRLPRPAGLDEGHQLALVVAGAAAADHLALRPVLHLGVERIAIPQRQRIDRLHVVMAVEQQMRAFALDMADHHRMAGGGPLRGRDPQRGQVGDQRVGGAVAIGLERRVGRDRGNAQQRHQPVERGGQVVVDAGEDGVEGHHGSPCAGAPTLWAPRCKVKRGVAGDGPGG